MEKILVDTSAWIASFASHGHEQLKTFLKEAILANSVYLTGIILLELLQGAKNEAQQKKMRERFLSLPSLPFSEDLWVRVAEFSLELRKKGVQVAVPDLTIAQIALEHSCLLLHQDHDYELIAKHSKLKELRLD